MPGFLEFICFVFRKYHIGSWICFHPEEVLTVLLDGGNGFILSNFIMFEYKTVDRIQKLIIPNVMCHHQNALEWNISLLVYKPLYSACIQHFCFTLILKEKYWYCYWVMFAQYSPNFQKMITLSVSCNCTFMFLFNNFILIYVEDI